MEITELLVCCVEQGLIPFLENISQGTSIISQDTTSIISLKDKGSKARRDYSILPSFTFPEYSIREISTKLLDVIALQLSNSTNNNVNNNSNNTTSNNNVNTNNSNHNVLLHRICNSMVYSGNIKLRVNIFSGLFLLVGRSKVLGGYI